MSYFVSHVNIHILSSGGGFSIKFNGDQLTVDYRTGSGGLRKVLSNPFIPSGWFHLAAVIDPNNNDIKIYINGNDQGGTTSKTGASTGPVNGKLWFHVE